MIYNATKKRPLFIGKPQPAMALLAMEKTGFTAEETVLVGDRLYTDIACGVNAGITSIFVLSGEGTLDDLAKSDVKPTYVYNNVKPYCYRGKKRYGKNYFIVVEKL
jgi:ribonucleotide monophosphatase NagD (HAD superfamily)